MEKISSTKSFFKSAPAGIRRNGILHQAIFYPIDENKKHLRICVKAQPPTVFKITFLHAQCYSYSSLHKVEMSLCILSSSCKIIIKSVNVNTEG